jgi:hypothetical protein
MLRYCGVEVWSRNTTSYINNAAQASPADIVYLSGHGYWLKRRPWAPARYAPAKRKRAA